MDLISRIEEDMKVIRKEKKKMSDFFPFFFFSRAAGAFLWSIFLFFVYQWTAELEGGAGDGQAGRREVLAEAPNARHSASRGVRCKCHARGW